MSQDDPTKESTLYKHCNVDLCLFPEHRESFRNTTNVYYCRWKTYIPYLSVEDAYTEYGDSIYTKTQLKPARAKNKES